MSIMTYFRVNKERLRGVLRPKAGRRQAAWGLAKKFWRENDLVEEVLIKSPKEIIGETKKIYRWILDGRSSLR